MFGAKLPWCQIVRCQIVLVPNCPVPNCPFLLCWCQIVLVPNCPVPNYPAAKLSWCQIVLVPNCPVPNCPVPNCPTTNLRWFCSIFPLFRQAKHFLLSPTPNSQKSTTHHPFNLSDQRHSRSVHKLNGGQARQSCPTHQHQHSRPTHKVHSWLLLAQQPNHRSKRLERTPLAALRWRHCQ